MLRKIKGKIGCYKKVVAGALTTCSLMTYNTIGVCAASGVSENLKNASSGAQQEALGWLEALGGLGIVIGGIIWFSGNSKLAKSIITFVAVGYILVKFAPDLWTWFISIF